MTRRPIALSLALLPVIAVLAQHATNAPSFAEATPEARRLTLAPGLKLEVWAAEPQLSNGVAFSFRAVPSKDPKAPPAIECYIAETHRWARSIFDITQHTNWLLADMSFRTVADRLAFLTNQFATNLSVLTADSELVRRVTDTDGDGRADRSEVVADGFNSPVDGTAAGVLAGSDGKLWFANIPNLWLLMKTGKRENGTSAADASSVPFSRLPVFSSSTETATGAQSLPAIRQPLATGFGVHIGVSGHDLHGLIKGPDGRIYMSFGDRGVCLTNREGVGINLPDTGGVLRCEPDGRDLEVFCFGLRNPQELAFDDFGNLWTVDNDTAGPDPCRVLHLVEGGDYGWRTSYQHMEGYGPWVQEELWKGGQDGILPPAGTVSQGPSGLAFYPGTGFGDRFTGTFLHCDFPGGVWAFTVKPQGASYVVDRKEKVLWNCWPTDVDFGPDGAAYVLDWVQGWGQPGKGRIHRITPNPELGTRNSELVAETQRLLAEGMTQRGEKDLLELLGHADRRVRLEAQWELAGRKGISLDKLLDIAFSAPPTLARIHAIWCLGQIAQSSYAKEVTEALFETIPLLTDGNEEIRSSVAKLLGETKMANAEAGLIQLLKDPSLRVEAAAARALGAIQRGQWGGSASRRHHVSGVRAFASRHLDKLPPLIREQAGALVSFRSGQGRTELVDLLSRRGSSDPFVFESVVKALLDYESGSIPPPALGSEASTNYRQAIVQLLRRVPPVSYSAFGPDDPRITNFLSDPDPRLIIAAGRAIHDVPIVEGFPALASFITKVDCPTNLYSRVIDACFRLGLPQHAQMLAGFANRRDVPDWARVLALRALADWGKPPPLDRVNGLWRPVVSLQTAENGKAEKRENETVSSSPRPVFQSSAAAAAAGVRPLVTPMQPPKLPADLGRSVPYAEGIAVTRNEALAKRAYLRVAANLLFPERPTETGLVLPGQTPVTVQLAVIDTAVKLHAKETGAPLFEKFSDAHTPMEVRRAVVPALAAIRAAQAGEAVKLALADKDAGVQASAVGHLDQLDDADAAGVLLDIIARAPGMLPNRNGAEPAADLPLIQAAFAALGRRLAAQTDVNATGQEQDAPGTLGRALEALDEGRLAPELELDVVNAAESSRNPSVKTRLENHRAKHAPDSSGAWSFALHGGNATAGRRVFLEKPETQCARCHQVGADGGTVGPRLDGIGSRQTRAYLLESILQPNAKIAPGFESAVITLKDGTSATGVVKRESADGLVLATPEAGETSVRPADIQSRTRGLSAMPEGLAGFLTKFELRDLVEYLASLK